MEKAKQSFEGLESYETGYKKGEAEGYEKGFSNGIETSMLIVNARLDTACKITSTKDEFYRFMKDTFELGGASYDKSGEKEERFCEGVEKAEAGRTAL